MTPSSYVDAIEATGNALADACLQCGKCFEACPMTTPAGLDGEDPHAVTAGIVDILRGGAGTPAAERWTSVCTSSGNCIPACDYGINPRLMVNLAGLAARGRSDPKKARAKGVATFNEVTRGIKIMARLQLAPDQLARVSPGPYRAADAGPPEVVFYTGCNILRTPHIALLCLDVLDLLKVDYEVMGGASHCCGVYQFVAGDAATSGRFAYSTLEKLAAAAASTVLSWCPSCQLQLGEIAIPSYVRSHGTAPVDLVPFVEYLAGRIDALRPLLRHPVHKRVALNERPAYPGVTAGVKALLSAIPGLEFVDLDVERVGLMSNNLSVLPDFKEQLRQREFRAAADAKVTTLATVYHACHREICHFEPDVSFEIVNFMELIGESMGIAVEDVYKRLRIMRDVDAVMADTRARIDQYKLDEDAVRNALLAEFWNGPPAADAPPQQMSNAARPDLQNSKGTT
jgi:heterodisulfide reductase subunit D